MLETIGISALSSRCFGREPGRGFPGGGGVSASGMSTPIAFTPDPFYSMMKTHKDVCSHELTPQKSYNFEYRGIVGSFFEVYNTYLYHTVTEDYPLGSGAETQQ
jgi:hypothetical protein